MTDQNDDAEFYMNDPTLANWSDPEPEEKPVDYQALWEEFKKSSTLTSSVDMPADPLADFEFELRALINKHSLENGPDCPDYAIAHYLRRAYENLCEVSGYRVDWNGMALESFILAMEKCEENDSPHTRAQLIEHFKMRIK
jgi:hypothetical protein